MYDVKTETSPEEKLRDYYRRRKELRERENMAFDSGILFGIEKALSILGITIEGVGECD